MVDQESRTVDAMFNVLFKHCESQTDIDFDVIDEFEPEVKEKNR
jgi:hypothetical protein